MSDAVWLAIIGIIGLVVKDWLDDRRARRAAVKVETVKKTLENTTATQDAKLDSQDKKLDQIKAQTNSALGRALKLTATTARSKADMTGTPADLCAADEAEKAVAEHEASQILADQVGKPSTE